MVLVTLGGWEAAIPFIILLTTGCDERDEELSGFVIVATTDLCNIIEFRDNLSTW